MEGTRHSDPATIPVDALFGKTAMTTGQARRSIAFDSAASKIFPSSSICVASTLKNSALFEGRP
jgi:hypothetical protein